MKKRMCNCEKPAFALFFNFFLLFRRFMIQRPSGEQLKKVQSKDVQHCLQQDSYNCGVYVIKVSAQSMNGVCCNIVLFCFFQNSSRKAVRSLSNTNIKYFFQQFASEIFKQSPEPRTNVSFSNKQCTLLKARVELANEILTTSGR